MLHNRMLSVVLMCIICLTEAHGSRNQSMPTSITQVFHVQTLNWYNPGSLSGGAGYDRDIGKHGPRQGAGQVDHRPRNPKDQVRDVNVTHALMELLRRTNAIETALDALQKTTTEKEKGLSVNLKNFEPLFNASKNQGILQELLFGQLGQLVRKQNNTDEILAHLENKITNIGKVLDNKVENDSSSLTEIVESVRAIKSSLADLHKKNKTSSTESNPLRHLLRRWEERLKEVSRRSFRDCEELYRYGYVTSGIYLIRPFGTLRPYPVYCEMTEGKGWTVIFRRTDASVNFDRPWKDYVDGFGDASGNYWLGLHAMHLLTNQFKCRLKVDIRKWGATVSLYAAYSTFKIGNSQSDYVLSVGGESGTAPRGKLTYNNGQRFSTKDKDNDFHSKSCVSMDGGPWWHNNCCHTLLTGNYTSTCTGSGGVYCMRWTHKYPLSTAVMKITRN